MRAIAFHTFGGKDLKDSLSKPVMLKEFLKLVAAQPNQIKRIAPDATPAPEPNAAGPMDGASAPTAPQAQLSSQEWQALEEEEEARWGESDSDE